MRSISAATIARRARRLAESFSLGLAAQLLAFVVGILVIRSLDRQSYVAYSLSGAIVGAVVVIADSGINSTLFSAAARAEHAGRFTALFSAALRWRRVLWAVVILPALVLLLWLLLKTGEPILLAVAIAALTGALSFNGLSIGLAAIDLLLSGRATVYQRLDTMNQGARLVLIGAAALVRAGNVVYYLALALVIGTVQRIVMTRRIAARHPAVPSTDADRSMFAGAIRSTVAASAFLIIGEQLVNLILVQRHDPLAIADIAALSRFAVAFNLLNTVAASIAAPFLAKAEHSRAGVARASSSFVAAYAVICAVYVGGILLFEPLLLAILGPQYDHLRPELVVIAVGSALTNFASFGLGLITHSRGWLRHSWTYGVFLAAWAVYGVFVADVSTPMGAALLSASLAVPLLLQQFVRVVAGFRSLPSAVELLPTVPVGGTLP